jgi:hypothetical protein
MNAVYKLIEIALNYALTLIMPLGIILRTFKFTRGAGGFLIAAGIAMHILLPLGILSVDLLGDTFKASTYGPQYASGHLDAGSFDTCTPGNTGDGNSDSAIGIYHTLRGAIRSYMFLLLVKATLGPVVSVLMMTAGLRYLSSLAGAEVDVSALARVV